MGLRFRKIVKLLPGIKLNISKSGTSLSVGRDGATTNINSDGIKTTVGMPGTGISYQTNRKGESGAEGKQNTRTLYYVLLGIVVAYAIWQALNA